MTTPRLKMEKTLPLSPSSFEYEDVAVAFDRMTAGDERLGFVPGYHYRILNETGVEVGHINFRVGDSEHVRLAAGHIGYEIAEHWRGRGYASKACLALGDWVRQVSGSVLLTVDPDNYPSIRTIERIGAAYLDTVDVPVGDPHYLRGSRRKKRYRWQP